MVSILADTPVEYRVKEVQLLVRDSVSIPAEIEPFVGKAITSSLDIFRTFKGLINMATECTS